MCPLFKSIVTDLKDLDKPRVKPALAAELCGETSEETPRSTEPPISERDLKYTASSNIILSSSKKFADSVNRFLEPSL